MDGSHFDTLTRTVAAHGSRRRVFTGLLGVTLGLALLTTSMEEVAARKTCPPCRKRKQGTCKKKKPDGTTCERGKTCQGGRCVAAAALCVSNCTGKECGGDGCDGSCGDCAGPRTCQSHRCSCPAAECGGNCVAACDPTRESRNPGTCGCCLVNDSVCDPDPAATPCCSGSGYCNSPTVGATPRCTALSSGALCEFDAQCDSGQCLFVFNSTNRECL
jgi:hypothetical protein